MRITHGTTYQGRYVADFECRRCHTIERRISPVYQDGKLRKSCDCGSTRAIQVGEWFATT